jgi:membrane protein YqaA with SNARE-associated domain
MSETTSSSYNAKRGITRRVYDWVLGWAKHPQAAWALFILALAESSFFPIPPDVLLIALVMGATAHTKITRTPGSGIKSALLSLFHRESKPAWRFAGICSVGSVVGGVIGFGIGYFLWWSAPGEYSGLAQFCFKYIPGFHEEAFVTVKGLYEDYGFWIVFTAGFTPIPYKIITISAGAFDINFAIFFIASLISRSARFFLVGGMIWLFGEWAKEFIDKYFNLLTILFAVLLIGGFMVVKLLF